MTLLKSLDLFSGVGGITRALEGIAEPKGYCEIKPESQRVLLARMRDGGLPEAPIFDDVTKLTLANPLVAHKMGTHIDLLACGWPCQDLSPMGLRKGMRKGTRSGLISEVYRLTDELKPSALLLENVPEVLNNGFDRMIDSFVRERGYEMRWVVVPASSVGAPHHRKRFFCLVMRPGWRPKFSGLDKYKTSSWAKEPPRMVVEHVPDRVRRVEQMGNSVVPDCVRAAFITLVRGFDAVPSRKLLRKTKSLQVTDVDMTLVERVTLKEQAPKWGCARVVDGKVQIFAVKQIPKMRVPDLKLVLDPKKFVRRRSTTTNTRGFISERIRKPLALSTWSTPRLISGSSNILTERTSRDLPTQVRFEVKTPERLRAGRISPQFAAFMMGYPLNWTRVSARTKKARP